MAVAPTGAWAASYTFSTPGEHALAIPAGVRIVHVTATGAKGGTGAASSYLVNALPLSWSPPMTDDFADFLAPGGFGDVVDADLALPSGTTKLFMTVGGRGGDAADTRDPDPANAGTGGFNGGGNGGGGQAGGGGGGGASDVRLCSAADTDCDSLASRLLIAAGGGGGGALFQEPTNEQLAGGPGGDGRAAGGDSMATYYVDNVVHGGAPGTLTAGGAGGAAAASETFGGGAGDFGAGGVGTFGTGPQAGGGGGGGGWYGGGAGAGGGKGSDLGFARYGGGAGGGGGSSYVAGLAGDALSAAITRATDAGGSVVVSWPDDATPPAVTVTAPDAPAGQNGFFGGGDVPVSVRVSATDPSGVTGLACTDGGAPVTMTGQSGTSPRTGTVQVSDQGTHALECTATDGLGNSGAADGSANTATVKIDRTAPTVTCGAAPVFELGESGARVTATVADGGSGALASPVTAPADTSSVGSHSAPVTGSDAAGNTTTEQCPYRVGYRFEGFFRPVDNDAPNVVNVGRTVPLKWRLLDADGRPVTDLDPEQVKVTVASLACTLQTTSDSATERAAGRSALQNHGDGYYQFDWKTPKDYAGSCKTLRVDLGEGAARTAVFEFRR